MNYIMRLRVGVPGHGRKFARLLGISTLSQTGKVKSRDKDPTCPITRYPAGNHGTIINYGVCHETDFIRGLRASGVRIINDPAMTAVACDKVAALTKLREAGVPTLEFTTDIHVAQMWAGENGGRVFCRTLTRAKKGKGIVIADSPQAVVRAPLYTKAFPKTHEYRVHVVNGEVIDWVQKRKSDRLATDNDGVANDDIRNKHMGWVFAHINRLGHSRIRDIGIAACRALQLDYAAVDILAQWAPKQEGKKRKLLDVRVCEVNSAPGCSAPTTLTAYVQSFRRIIDG